MIRCKRTVKGVSWHFEPGDVESGFYQFEYDAGRWRYRVSGGEWSEWKPVELEAGAGGMLDGAEIPVDNVYSLFGKDELATEAR